MKPLVKILYIDDEEINLELFRWTFKNQFNVLTAISAKEGLAVLEAHDVPVVVTDLKMPEMDGLQLIEIIKRKSPEKICIMLTGFIDLAAKAKSNIVFNVLAKPWKKNELQKAIQTGIEAYQKEIN